MVAAEPATTVVAGSAATVVDEPAAHAARPLWRAESNGDLFPASRVRRIERAQDALTHSEECVYDCLWGPKNTARDESRLTQIGYDRLAKTARITKRNAALIVERLIAKGFVKLEAPADPLRRIARQYRVLCYRAALDELRRCGREWVVRSGNGVLFVHSVTIVAEPATTVVAAPPATVIAAAAHLQIETLPSSALADVCSKYGIVLDAAAERLIPKRCRAYDKAATEEEIAYFSETKILQLAQSRNVTNLVGLLMTAVPEFFVEPAHELRRYRATKLHEQERSAEIARQILENPDATKAEREWAQAALDSRPPR